MINGKKLEYLIIKNVSEFDTQKLFILLDYIFETVKKY